MFSIWINSTPFMIVTPTIQVRSKSIIYYSVFENRGFRTQLQLDSAEKLKERKTYSGILCPGAKKRLTKAIELIVQAEQEQKPFNFIDKFGNKCIGKFKLNFITLTIHSPEKLIKGKEAHKLCLEPMLLWLRRSYGMTLYVWKAELQNRGQLHYHITSNCFIPWDELRKKWNELQMAAGYLESYYCEHGHFDANSTDVHSVYKVKDMASYLKKSILKTYAKDYKNSLLSEFQKEVQNTDTIGGKVWDCSLCLKNASYYQTDASEGYEFDYLVNQLDIEVKKPGNDFIITNNCTIYKFTDDAFKFLNPRMKDDYFDAMAEIKNFKRIPKTEFLQKILPTSLEDKIETIDIKEVVPTNQRLIELMSMGKRERGKYLDSIRDLKKKKEPEPIINITPQLNLFSPS